MIRLNEQGLAPAIVQDIKTKAVLMLGYVNPDSLQRTMEGGEIWFYSRSREDLWHKGEVSGNFMVVKKAFLDCDNDTLLFQVEPAGPACHTGETTCFFTSLEDSDPGFESAGLGSGILEELFAVIQQRKRDLPKGSYTAELLKAGSSRVAQKVVEEAGESAIAAAQGQVEEVPKELADLFYHALVLLAASGATPEAVWQELRSRQR
jgi:phosphoribosyl-ATP pyrophosphohydrolase/phosphoribosyl-AMP cyclohydrolase